MSIEVGQKFVISVKLMELPFARPRTRRHFKGESKHSYSLTHLSAYPPNILYIDFADGNQFDKGTPDVSHVTIQTKQP